MFGRATLDGVEPRHAVLGLLVPHGLSHSVANLSAVVSSGTADLLLLDANPLQDIRNATRIRGVILNGRLSSEAVLCRCSGQARS